ncbi:MAG: hypothetical protein M3384_07850 [Acidobacteriota bacterium]|nr:hypothetical protein [Acidobacteriota bacterium]
MYKTLAITAFFILFASLTVPAQDAVKPTYFQGDVVSVTSDKLSLQTKDGATMEITLLPTTAYKKVSPEKPKISEAVDATLADIGAGDKIVVSSIIPADRKSIPARTVYLMTKSDISKRNEAERAAWQTRGISGRVVSIDVPNKKVVLAVRGVGGERNITMTPKQVVEYRRYAPDSVRFADAKPSSFGELSIGDQVRALGDRGADGATFEAEKIVSGSFKMVGGTITAIDAAKKEITIKDIQTNKEVVIAVNDSSILKNFPPDAAQMMVARMTGGGMQPPGGGNTTMRPPNQGGNQQNPQQLGGGGGGGQMRGGRGEFDDMIERFPNISLADLKIGGAVAASSTASATPGRVTAINLLSGVEPFFAAAAQAQQRGGGNNQSSPSLNIPGLDGIGLP